MMLMHHPYPALFTLVFGPICIACQLRGLRRTAGIAKILASWGFVLAAMGSPLATSSYGHRLVAASICGAVGDALLVGSAPTAFAAGITAFLLGHVFYMQGMLLWGFNKFELGCFLLMMLAITSVVKAWLWPYVPMLLRPMVLLYMVTSALLVACTLSCSTNHPRPLFALFGVTAFFVSDLFVAQERFCKKTRLQTLLGLPLYWLAQWSLVATMGLG